MSGTLKKYQLLLEAVPVGIGIVSQDGKIIESNKAFRSLFKIKGKKTEAGIIDHLNIICEDGTNLDINKFPWIVAIREKRNVDAQELRIRLSDESIRWYETAASPFFYETDAAIVIATDITEKKNNYSKIKDSEEQYKLLFENSGEAILLTNPDGAIYSANTEACKMYGMTEEEICNKGREGLIDKTDPRLKVGLRERKEKFRFKGEINQIKKDGTVFPTEIISTVYKDKSGNEKTNTIIRDITEQKKVEKDLFLASVIMKNITEGINLVRLDDEIIVFTNPKFDVMFGYERGELIGKQVAVLNAPTSKNPDDVKREIIEAVKLNGGWHGEILNIRKNNVHFWSYVNVSIFDHSDFGKVYVSVHSDITERRKAEEKLRDASLYTRELIEASIDPFVTISAWGKITDVNLATERVTGINRKKLIGSDFSDYFSDPVKAREVYMKVFEKGLVKDYPLTILHKNGRKTPVLYNASLYKNSAGEVQGVFAAARDITVQNKIEEELHQSKNLLEKLNQSLHDVWEKEKSQIAMNLHDDLGQKFTALSMDLAWIKSRIGVQSKPVVSKLNEMHAEINDSIEGLKEISSFLRPSILFDLGLIPAITWHLDKFERQSGIKCNFRFNSEELKLDERTSLILYRIFQESLTNIARHSQATRTLVELNKSKDSIIMSINDNGIGLENGKINSINSMGIAGIKERTKMARGELSIKGKKGVGTTVIVKIPLIKSEGND